jgi:hypothetical protein
VRFEEGKGAGWGVREFRNLDPPREGGADLEWATKVVQRGTRVTTGRLEGVTAHYRDGRRRTFHGAQANRILQTVREARADAEPLPARYRRVQEVR